MVKDYFLGGFRYFLGGSDGYYMNDGAPECEQIKIKIYEGMTKGPILIRCILI